MYMCIYLYIYILFGLLVLVHTLCVLANICLYILHFHRPWSSGGARLPTLRFPAVVTVLERHCAWRSMGSPLPAAPRRRSSSAASLAVRTLVPRMAAWTSSTATSSCGSMPLRAPSTFSVAGMEPSCSLGLPRAGSGGRPEDGDGHLQGPGHHGPGRVRRQWQTGSLQ